MAKQNKYFFFQINFHYLDKQYKNTETTKPPMKTILWRDKSFSKVVLNVDLYFYYWTNLEMLIFFFLNYFYTCHCTQPSMYNLWAQQKVFYINKVIQINLPKSVEHENITILIFGDSNGHQCIWVTETRN